MKEYNRSIGRELIFYKFLVFKTYFDSGYGLTSYFKYLVAFLGVSGLIAEVLSFKQVVYIGIGYGVFCYIIGRLWYYLRLPEISAYIDNKFDPFVHEMMKSAGQEIDRNI